MTREEPEVNKITSAHKLGYDHGMAGGAQEPPAWMYQHFLALAAYKRGKVKGTKVRLSKAFGRSE